MAKRKPAKQYTNPLTHRELVETAELESKIYEVCRDEHGGLMVKFDRRKRSLMCPVT